MTDGRRYQWGGGNLPPGVRENDPAAPWNQPEDTAECVICAKDCIVGDVYEIDGQHLCDACTATGGRLCGTCGTVADIGELWARDTSPAGRSCVEFEYFCDGCAEELLDRYPQPNALESFETEHVRGAVAESMIDARRRCLPERIALWCAANEPERIAADVAGRLCSTFADLRCCGLTQYEARVLWAVTEGGWRK